VRWALAAYSSAWCLFAALPTATSAYVLGGDGPMVARAVTISTLAGMLAIPLAQLRAPVLMH